MKVLVIDVGGNNLKISGTGKPDAIKVPSGPKMTAAAMVEATREATQGWTYDAVSIGYPGPVHDNRPASEPHNLASGWVKFDFQKAFGKPVRMMNDAAMQALGAYRGGRMLFLGLGTGLGSALIEGGTVVPLELAHLPYKKGREFEDYVGEPARKRMGVKKWARAVHKVVAILQAAMVTEDVVLGGGNTARLPKLPSSARAGSNADAARGGLLMWDAVSAAPRRAARRR